MNMSFARRGIVVAVMALAACAGDPPPDSPRADGGYSQAGGMVPGGRGGALDASAMGGRGVARGAPGSQEDLAQSVGDRVFFDTDKVEPKPESRQILQRQAEWLRRYGNVVVTIEGHADERGLREYNLALGERRAQSVKNTLIALGIDPNRLHTLSYGKERPAVLRQGAAGGGRLERGGLGAEPTRRDDRRVTRRCPARDCRVFRDR